MWDAVGVSGYEGRIYEALVPQGQATAAELAEATGLGRERTMRLLGRLADRGMVSRVSGRPARFAAVAPEVAASSLIADRERGLRRLRSHARKLTETQRGHGAAVHPAGLIEVIEGASNIRNAFVRLQQDARREVRVFDKPPYTGDQPEGNEIEYRHLAEGSIRYRTLYDRAALALPGRMSEIWNGIRNGERARVAGSLPMKMALCDDRRALIPTSVADYGTEAAYLVHPSSLLDALSELFEALWQRAVPLNQAPAKGGPALTDRDRDLIGLLAGGATDETIARTFGWSTRTVQRHIHRIMTSTGAQTRFQAGMEAVRRAWV